MSDVSVIRRADCWTDHRLRQAKITLRYRSLVAQQPVRRHFAAYKLSNRNVGLAFNEEVVRRVNSTWNDDMSTQEK